MDLAPWVGLFLIFGAVVQGEASRVLLSEMCACGQDLVFCAPKIGPLCSRGLGGATPRVFLDEGKHPGATGQKKGRRLVGSDLVSDLAGSRLAGGGCAG